MKILVPQGRLGCATPKVVTPIVTPQAVFFPFSVIPRMPARTSFQLVPGAGTAVTVRFVDAGLESKRCTSASATSAAISATPASTPTRWATCLTGSLARGRDLTQANRSRSESRRSRAYARRRPLARGAAYEIGKRFAHEIIELRGKLAVGIGEFAQVDEQHRAFVVALRVGLGLRGEKPFQLPDVPAADRAGRLASVRAGGDLRHQRVRLFGLGRAPLLGRRLAPTRARRLGNRAGRAFGCRRRHGRASLPGLRLRLRSGRLLLLDLLGRPIERGAW